MTAPSGLVIDSMTFRRRRRLIIDDVDCTVPAGSLAALVGPNGSGKLTCCTSWRTSKQPTPARSPGSALADMRRKVRARRLALAHQNVDTEVDISVTETVMLDRVPHLPVAPGERDRQIVAQALRRVGASFLAERSFQQISAGERQRVLLARASAQEPSMLLLDEPANHLDIAAQLEASDVVRSLTADGLTGLAALHDLNLAMSLADQVIMLSAGRVVAAGAPEETLTPELIATVYGVRAQILRRADGSPTVAFAPMR